MHKRFLPAFLALAIMGTFVVGALDAHAQQMSWWKLKLKYHIPIAAPADTTGGPANPTPPPPPPPPK